MVNVGVYTVRPMDPSWEVTKTDIFWDVFIQKVAFGPHKFDKICTKCWWVQNGDLHPWESNPGKISKIFYTPRNFNGWTFQGLEDEIPFEKGLLSGGELLVLRSVVRLHDFSIGKFGKGENHLKETAIPFNGWLFQANLKAVGFE